MIFGLAHVALYTDKFEETIAFYKNAFDAEEVDRFWIDKNGCNLRLGNLILEVFESPKLPDCGCFKHIALHCDNVDAAYQKALEQGAQPFVAPKDVDLALNKRIAFVKGVNREQIELCELR